MRPESCRCWSGQPIRGPSPCQILTLELDHQRDPGQSRSERTRTAIHFAAEKLFLEHGFEGVSMDRISELSGVTKQTVYSYVGSKEALFLNVVDSMTGSAGDELDNVAPQPLADTSPEQFLTRFAEEQLQIVVTPRLMKLRRMVIGEMTRFPELGALLHRRGPARSIDRLSRALARYADDLRLPGMLHARILRSPHAHARILSIDATRALALPGVHAVLGLVSPGERVIFAGQDVAAVAAERPEQAMTLDELIEDRVRELRLYQDEAYAQRYRARVERVRAAERQAAQGEALTRAVAETACEDIA